MPLPKPRSGEQLDDFISRCHSAAADEFPDQEQRHAVCMTQWRSVHPGSAPPPKAADEPTCSKAYVPFDLKTLDLAAREFSGLASTWDVDLDKERFQKGAFAQTIRHWKESQKGKQPRIIPLIDQHNYKSVRNVFGKVIDLQETSEGLFLRGQILATPDGDEYLARIKGGFLNGLSVGFDTVNHKVAEQLHEGTKQRIRVITEALLREVSAVIWGANPNALTAAVKSLLKEKEGREAVAELRNQLDGLLQESDNDKMPPAEPADEPKEEPRPPPAEEPAPEPEAEPLVESADALPKSRLRQEVEHLEAQLAELTEQKQAALREEDYITVQNLHLRLEGLQARIQRRKTALKAEAAEAQEKASAWAPDGQARLRAEARMAALNYRAALQGTPN